MSGKVSSIRTQTAKVADKSKQCPYCNQIGMIKWTKWAGWKCQRCKHYTQNPIPNP